MSKVLEGLLSKEWYEAMEGYLNSGSFLKLGKIIHKERLKYNIYPEKSDLFKCFRLCPLSNTKIVLIGQDPYHTKGAADGLSFSNSKIDKPSPSLRNILKEIDNSYPENIDCLKYGRDDKKNLIRWAIQGVLLLNTAQTVREGFPGSHLKLWQEFTNEVIEAINRENDIIWLLLGNKAFELIPKINKYHCVLKAAHPAAEIYKNGTAGFFNSNIFKKANNELQKRNRGTIHW